MKAQPPRLTNKGGDESRLLLRATGREYPCGNVPKSINSGHAEAAEKPGKM